MDYNKIIANGLLDENTKKHLDLYFYREYQNAKDKHYTLTEFFDGLIHAIKQMQSTAENNREDALKRLNEDIEFAKAHPPETEEDAKRELRILKARADSILNSELTIDIENEDYKGKIPLEALKHLIGIITLVFERAVKKEGLQSKNQNAELTENQKETIKKILPKINHYISENSTFEQWEKVLTAQEPSNKIKIKCSNKLLAEFISKLKIKFKLNIADAFFSKCFEGNKPISQRFIEVGTSRPPTEPDRKKLNEIFKAVQ